MTASANTATAAPPQRSANGTPTRLDALVIGAGIAGLYQLHRMREMGLKVRAYDTASGVGGTWYWNRYPGARFDSQAEVYQYWFSEDLYKSWKPSERFPAQPETETWLNFVADRLDLKKDIQFNTRIVSAHYRDDTGRWDVTTDAGERIDTQYLLACCGMLSAPLVDRFPGQSSFKGTITHTGLWPKEGIDLKGKRVAVVGTGATGIQVIQTIGPIVGSLKVFSRTPQYVVPMKNPKYSKEDWDRWSSQFHDLKKRVRQTFAGFHYDFENRPWAELGDAERTQVLEKFWEDGSLSMWLATFPEMFFDESVSEVVSEFVRGKMRARLRNDEKLCKTLIPGREDYGFGTHRVPLENKYLEVYLQDNVEAIDCRKTPIERIVPEGIQTSDGKVHEFDVIVLAVGFDAGSGALSRIDIRGRGGRSLKDQWQQEIRTAMGLQVHGYPNLFTTGAPLAPSAALCNMTTCLQQQVDWITDCIAFARSQGKSVVEASKEFEDRWVQHHDETAAATLVVKTDSWYMGSNVDGKPRRLLSYIGGVGNYHRQCDELAASGYPGFTMA
ncbi:flavin-containing monooxygenase [Piscinibacter sp.]|uniref:flavin-containing monooxygenase n=1 Tax=Piscinibacter sp. TaxID=1903157 RepID=UPI0039E21E07